MPMILNEEQNQLKDMAKSFCTDKAPIDQLRRLRDEDNADGFDRETWTAMAELGFAGAPFPEEHGGIGFGYKGLGVITEETGRTLSASPLFSSVWSTRADFNFSKTSTNWSFFSNTYSVFIPLCILSFY